MALTLFAGALAASSQIYATWGYQPNFPKSDEILKPNNYQCLSSCGYGMHDRELRLGNIFAEHKRSFIDKWVWGWFSSLEPDKSVLQFDKNSARKTLILSAEYDRNGALNPAYIVPLIKNMTLFRQDVKYKVVSRVEEICQEIKQPSPQQIQDLWMFAHGQQNGMAVYDPSGRNGWWHKESKLPPDCFDNMDPGGTINLISQDTALDVDWEPYSSFAQRIADISGLKVIGANGMVCPSMLRVIKENGLEAEPYHINEFSSSDKRNVFKFFLPRVWEAEKPHQTTHLRDDQLKEVLEKPFKKSTLQHPDNLSQYIDGYFEFSKKDPRNKFLFLSASRDHTPDQRPTDQGPLHPRYIDKMLIRIAQEVDIKFKVVKNDREVAKEIKDAIKAGELPNIVFMAHGNPEGIQLSDDPRKAGAEIKVNGYNWDVIRKSLEGFSEDGEITLISCCTGGGKCEEDKPPFPEENSFASVMSDELGAVVNAPRDLIYPSYIKVDSVRKFRISQFSSTYPGENTFRQYKGANKP